MLATLVVRMLFTIEWKMKSKYMHLKEFRIFNVYMRMLNMPLLLHIKVWFNKTNSFRCVLSFSLRMVFIWTATTDTVCLHPNPVLSLINFIWTQVIWKVTSLKRKFSLCRIRFKRNYKYFGISYSIRDPTGF